MRLGKVEKLFRGKLLLVRGGRRVPRIGDTIYGPDLHPIGKVLDIMGRVDEPFVLVKPFKEDIAKRMIGRTLYFRTPKPKEARSQKKKKGGREKGRRHRAPKNKR